MAITMIIVMMITNERSMLKSLFYIFLCNFLRDTLNKPGRMSSSYHEPERSRQTVKE